MKSINQSTNQSINFRVAYVTNSYHKDHARKKVKLRGQGQDRRVEKDAVLNVFGT